ncbi:MAG: hypothetical protein E7375_02515 [Clostridiales bacterium]|nr:hypothetical protein [Clostridiales bacterium]
MEEMIIDEGFENKYLEVGNINRNTLLENCPRGFLPSAKETLEKQEKSIVVSLDQDFEADLEAVLEKCSDELKRKFVVCGSFNSLIISKIYQKAGQESLRGVYPRGCYEDILTAIKSRNWEEVQRQLKCAPFDFDVDMALRNFPQAELSFFLDGIKNKYLTQKINDQLCARKKIKVFSVGHLAGAYTSNGVLVQSVHDYDSVRVGDFVKVSSDKEKNN